MLRLLCGLIGAEFAAQCASELLDQGMHPDGYTAVLLAAECLHEVREMGAIQQVRTVARKKLLGLTQYKFPYHLGHAEAATISRVRMRAVQELARGWKDDPDIHSWLRRRALHHDNSEVRRAAVQELARGWKDHPDTLPWLRDRAARDLDQTVRWTAVQELARGWKEDPRTLSLLRNHATRDRDRRVRRAALRELARGWKDHPDTLPWLRCEFQPLMRPVSTTYGSVQ